MEIIETFGHTVEKLCEESPEKARTLLKTGWEAQGLKFRLLPDRRLQPADRYLAKLMMDTMLKPLKNPADSAIVSIFTPCELLSETGLSPYNAEAFSCYVSASKAEGFCMEQALSDGISETLCSYHKTFLGAAKKGLLPRPRCIVYTNLICDANLVTFRALADLYQAPSFFIDVPLKQNEENVRYVADQLKELAAFLEEQTGREIDEERLKERVASSSRSLKNYQQFQKERAGKYIPTDLVTPLYAGMTQNILLGSREEEKYTEMLLKDVEKAAPARGKRIYWMHTIPFWSSAVREALAFKEDAQIVGCELAQVFDGELDPEKPYESMARRMVYHNLNGGISRRIEAGIRHAKEAEADGVVWFAHWGCKHTLGGARLAKKRFEEAGIPLLILDGDGCDQSYGGEGQTSTRLGAFLEMLGGAHE
ncbi:MAG: 2-hydroxyacyl-CoA dehydratase family protein [Lachnospiraceae bacterium]|nr:2-hydroxyacyl-CoA dehydratase family protein [Lachnospiraceae bacterium]